MEKLHSKITAFDIYRKLPADLVQSTYSGAFISLISAAIMFVLFLSELNVTKNKN